MTESIESNKILRVNDDEVEIQLVMSLKCTVIITEPVSIILNIPHSTSRVFCKTKVVNSQHNSEAMIDYYSQEDNSASGLASYVYRYFMVLIPAQNMFKMFPYI